MPQQPPKQLLVCIENDEYRASLEKRKIYVALNDSAASKHGFVRVIDESGGDYLYPKELFKLITVPPSVAQTILATA